MPVVGIVSPAHRERKSDTYGRKPKWLTPEQALAAAAGSDPKWAPYSYEVLSAALGTLQDRDYISTTALLAPCPRSLVLERREDYIADLDQLWRAFRGTLAHSALEDNARPGSIAEVRFFAPIDQDEISCTPDLITPGTIWDYKLVQRETMPVYNYPKRYHEEQLQFNRYIVNNATHWEKKGKPYDLPWNAPAQEYHSLVVVYLGPDYPKLLACEKSIQVANQSGHGTHPKRVSDVWSDKVVLELMRPRYRALKIALDSFPTWPKGLEQVWQGPADWSCPGPPHCWLKNCLAKRYPRGLTW